MNKTTLRILDILSSEINRPLSINSLTDKIYRRYNAGYYRDVYENIQELTKSGILQISKSGRSSIVSLNFDNGTLVDILAEMELERKLDFVQKRKEFQILLSALASRIIDYTIINFVLMIYSERNAKLNRAELAFMLKDSKDLHNESEMTDLIDLTGWLESEYNIKIDALFMTREEFIEKLRSESINPIKEMMADKIAIFFPQAFWLEIKHAMETERPLKIEEHEINPSKVTEQDLVSNLAVLGYKEIGTEIKPPSRLIGIEYVITAVLMRENQRRKEAIPIIIAKNEDKINYDLLIFLSTKYKTLQLLFGLLKALNQIKPIDVIKNALKRMAAMKIEEIHIDIKSIEEKLRLYNVIK
ncbi:MAG: hypothetical protein KGL95_03020 [Patescibacteria group bacterium]|nr:hypothetical protein [Patescibacteria group bacterium]